MMLMMTMLQMPKDKRMMQMETLFDTHVEAGAENVDADGDHQEDDDDDR